MGEQDYNKCIKAVDDGTLKLYKENNKIKVFRVYNNLKMDSPY